MLPLVKGTTEGYLDSLNRIQSALDLVQRQVSSGVRVGKPSDDPTAVLSILKAQSQVATDKQTLSNLNQLKTELETGDNTLQNASKLLEQAIGLASQGAAGNLTNTSGMAVIAQQVQAIQQQLVDLSRTAVSGRYIFSGDYDQQPQYALDNTQPNGVLQLAVAVSTRAVTDDAGATIWIPRTAQDIFDARNPDDSIATGNVFAAINGLLVALQNGDSAGAAAALNDLKAADDHVNQQLGFYGIAQTRVAASEDSANQSLVTESRALSNLRDTDVPAAAVQLSQVTLQQQAALTVRAKISQLSLFDFLA